MLLLQRLVDETAKRKAGDQVLVETFKLVMINQNVKQKHVQDRFLWSNVIRKSCE